MHLATTILRRFTEAFQRANLFVLLLFWRATFFGTFPARNVKVSSTLSLASNYHFQGLEFPPCHALHDPGRFLERARTTDESAQQSLLLRGEMDRLFKLSPSESVRPAKGCFIRSNPLQGKRKFLGQITDENDRAAEIAKIIRSPHRS